MVRRGLALVACLAVMAPLVLAGCSSQDRDGWDGTGPVPISLWSHSAGNEGEMKVISRMITEFNASQSDYEVVRQDFPQDAYNTSVQGAAASNDLPCILDVDGPIMPRWAWNGWLVPPGLTEKDVANFLPSTVGRYDGQIYTVGYWDATTALFSRRSVLERSTASVFPAWIARGRRRSSQRRSSASRRLATSSGRSTGAPATRASGTPMRTRHCCKASGAISSTGRTTRRPTAS